MKKLHSQILITGDTGFVGQHVLESWPHAIGLSSVIKNIDIRDKQALSEAISKVKPTAVLHLAALSFVPDSFKSPEKTFDVNLVGTLRLLEALKDNNFSGRLLYVGTGDAYGLVPEIELPVREDRALRPRSPYAVSKLAAEALCYQWSQTEPFEVLMARPFNHIGIGQSPNFAISGFAKQIAQINSGISPPSIRVGNLEITRDFTDVKDILRAYELILTQGHNGTIYNVCSGQEYSLRSMLERLLMLSGVQATIELDPALIRPVEQTRMRGSYKLLQSHTGWAPASDIDETLLKIYNNWKNLIHDGT